MMTNYPAEELPESRTPVLDNFSIDITNLAEKDRLDIIYSREIDLEKLVTFLTLRTNNNPVIVSPSASYRNAIVERLAMQIIMRKVTRSLFNKRIVKLDITSLSSVMKNEGELRIRMQSIITELEKNRDIILFIEDIHQFLESQSGNNIAILANVLKVGIYKGNIQIIGCASPEGIRKIFEQQSNLKRYFQQIDIGLPSIEETVYILHNICSKYEEFHNVIYADEALKACAILSDKYISESFLLDKAIDVMDEVGARVHLKNSHVPKHIEELEKQIEEIKEIKDQAVKNKQYEKAADLRDKEIKLTRQLEFAKLQWEEDSKTKRYPVMEGDVYEVFQLKTGFSAEALLNGKGALESEVQEEIVLENNYFKEKVDEYDLENKTSIKINDIPDYLKTTLQQYILFFKDYLEKVKGKEIFFEVSKIEEGLRIDINPEEIENFEEFNAWFNEYLDFIRKKNEDFTVNFEKDVEVREAEIVMAELKNQVRHLESQLELIQLQVKNLTNGDEIFNKLSLDVSEQQKYLIEQGYSNVDTFRFKLKENLGQGKVKSVLDELFKYISKSSNNDQQDLDEIILFNSRLSELDFKLSANVISYDEEKIEKQKIYKAMLGFVNKL